MQTIFVTGTDTAVGKTYVSTLLLKALNQLGYSTIGLKPIASGCEYNQAQQLVNEDALALQTAASIRLPYDAVNPIKFKEAVAPHIPAEQTNRPIDVESVKQHIIDSSCYQADIAIVEGAGGWLVPIHDNITWADIVADLKLPTILVVGMRLGCINHALLSVESILNRGVNLLGWVANCIEPNMAVLDENIETLKQRITQPLIDIIAYKGQKLTFSTKFLPKIA